MLTPEEQHMFDQLAMSPVWKGWLDKQEREQMTVLKNSPHAVQLAQAQGAARLIDAMKAASGIK